MLPLLACTCTRHRAGRKERIISGIFVGVLAVVIAIAAPRAGGRVNVPIFVCNFLALSAYCVWRFLALVQPCCLCVAVAQQQQLIRRRYFYRCSNKKKKKQAVVPRSASRICRGSPRTTRSEPWPETSAAWLGAAAPPRSSAASPRRRHDASRQADHQKQGRRRGRLPERDLHRRERAPAQPCAHPRRILLIVYK
jgi:hypothetical protein